LPISSRHLVSRFSRHILSNWSHHLKWICSM
jgi:hypothetical protein